MRGQSPAEATMAYVKFHHRDGGYRVHTDDGSVEPGVYVSYHQAASRARALNLTAPGAETPARRVRRRRLLRRAS
jgi:hypothetical protein